jgi:GNAT superfamily N-acetyltransferase
MMTIRRAIPADLDTVLTILHTVADWLHSRGYDQWPDGSPSLGPKKISAQIERGEFWLVHAGRDPIAVIAVSSVGDADFWTSAEMAEPAFYIAKAAVVRPRAGEGLGAMLLRWACDYAADNGARWVRLDAWRTNTDLHSYYRRQGWEYLRTVPAPGRNSGALFQRPAVSDLAARVAFTTRDLPTRALNPQRLEVDARVLVATDEGPVSARVTHISADWSHGVTDAGWEYEVGDPPHVYSVERDGRSWTVRAGQIWLDPDYAAPSDVYS